jgi:hypothetical protein
MLKQKLGRLLLALLCLYFPVRVNAKSNPPAKSVSVVVSANSHSRVKYGATKLIASLKAHGYTTALVNKWPATAKGAVVAIGNVNDNIVKSGFQKVKYNSVKPLGKEGFTIQSSKNTIIIGGADNSGALYGCLELSDIVSRKNTLPTDIHQTDKPEMVMRGTCIGVQKPELLPGRGTYEYPYTPQNFPWFYDKALWLRYLDSLASNRMNSLYLWNGHPFSSLVKVKEYPYALEVDEATFKKNEEIYRFLAQEADRRGIWLVQGFYNIIIPKPFAEKHHLATQDRNRPIIPLISDYTRKSIAAFVEKYPNVGLLITLGEAMEGVGQDDVDWFTKTIIPGVKDGLKALGRTDEPPIVLRGHDTDAPNVMKYALPLYKNLYTEAKYNGEALTTYTPHGPWADLHRTLSRIGTVQIENVHIMANLEPFRYGSADFIQKCVLAMHNVYEANGLHLYPQASYWDWPYSADKADHRLLQLDRDWIWYKEWARYSWNCHRDRKEEIEYWGKELAARYGCTEQQGKDILEAYEQSGEISPQILRRVGITDGNRQTMTLGMLMSQFVNPEKFGLFSLLYNSEAPVGEILSEYTTKEWNKEPHVGETPMMVADRVPVYGKRAVEAIDKAAPDINRNKAEFERLKNDMYCYDAMANSYSAKIKAAIHILRYKYSNNVADLEKAVPDMERSLTYYKKLVDLTKDSYLYANSMQTRQRKIPVNGLNGAMKTWAELYPLYEKELANFKKNIDSLKSPANTAKKVEKQALNNAQVSIISGGDGMYTLQSGAQPFADTAAVIKSVAAELVGLKGVKLTKAQQLTNGTAIKFSNTQPVKVLVGFFNERTKRYSPTPQLETDASANDFGQADVKISNAILIPGMPAVNLHTYSFKPGTNTLNLSKGAGMILGFVTDNQQVPVYDAGLLADGNIKDLRWLFN